MGPSSSSCQVPASYCLAVVTVSARRPPPRLSVRPVSPGSSPRPPAVARGRGPCIYTPLACLRPGDIRGQGGVDTAVCTPGEVCQMARERGSRRERDRRPAKRARTKSRAGPEKVPPTLNEGLAIDLSEEPHGARGGGRLPRPALHGARPPSHDSPEAVTDRSPTASGRAGSVGWVATLVGAAGRVRNTCGTARLGPQAGEERSWSAGARAEGTFLEARLPPFAGRGHFEGTVCAPWVFASRRQSFYESASHTHTHTGEYERPALTRRGGGPP